MSLRTYQEDAVKELVRKSNKLLNLSGNKVCLFRAPTGSGKTIMMADFLKRLVEYRSDNKSFSFIWAAPRNLHTQSKKKLQNYYHGNGPLICSYFEDLMDKKIQENEILFLNWESINKSDNIYIKDNEQNINLSSIINNTKEDGREIILVIDESHHTAQTETSRKLINDISPKLTINVSATDGSGNTDEIVNVDIQTVKKAGMIKKGVLINPNFQGVEVGDRSTDEVVLDEAIKQREYLKKQYEDIGKKDINPLLLIQLPDKQEGTEDKKEIIQEILAKKYNITTQNRKLAIYLSEDKENLENISKNDNEVEVMIFKQAIALGWDCPRASILVLFREWKSISFSIQTVGRIMRMPELKHYENAHDLNFAYVYTNVEQVLIEDEIAKDYITRFESKRILSYKSIGLTSYNITRHREKTRLSPLFSKIFMQTAIEYDLKNKIKLEVEEENNELVTDVGIENINKVENQFNYNTIKIRRTDTEFQTLFTLFVIEALAPDFSPEPRSVGRVRSVIYDYFWEEHQVDYESSQREIINIVLSKKNRHHFINIIERSKEKYKLEVQKREVEVTTNKSWEIPEFLTFSDKYEKMNFKKSVIQPFFIKKEYRGKENELKFIFEYLESNEDIIWWFKNGDRDDTFFSVKYTDSEGKDRLFFVDFIVMYKNGKVGLYDTKSGITADVAKEKAEGLACYIKEENNKGKQLDGGIIINVNGVWRINRKEKYTPFNVDNPDWEIFN